MNQSNTYKDEAPALFRSKESFPLTSLGHTLHTEYNGAFPVLSCYQLLITAHPFPASPKCPRETTLHQTTEELLGTANDP